MLKDAIASAGRVCIVADKCHIITRLKPVFDSLFPGAHIDWFDAGAYTVQPRLPRDLPLSGVPHLSGWSTDMIPHDRLRAALDARGLPMLEERLALRAADLVVNACDADPQGAVKFALVMRDVRGVDLLAPHAPCFPMLWLLDCSDEGIRTAIERGETTQGEGFHLLLRGGALHRRFSLNWAMNAAPVLGQAMRAAGAAQDAGFPSKHGLQTLYMLRREGPLGMGSIIRRMRDNLFGSPMSRAQIIEDLLAMGLCLEMPAPEGRDSTGCRTRTLIAASPLGLQFLDLLHKRCEDPGFGRRLWTWMQRGDTQAADDYIRLFFSRQKKFLPKRLGRGAPLRLAADLEAQRRDMEGEIGQPDALLDTYHQIKHHRSMLAGWVEDNLDALDALRRKRKIPHLLVNEIDRQQFLRSRQDHEKMEF